MFRGGAPIYTVRKVCYMSFENAFTKLGFVKDENNACFNKVFKNNIGLNELYIDIYNENPISHSSSMLLLRTYDKNISVINKNNRFILKRNDDFNTYIVNVVTSKIKIFYKKTSDNYVDFLLNICNVWYKITVFI